MVWLRMQWQLQGRSGKPTTGSDNSNFTWEVEHASPALCQHSRDRPVDLTLRLGVCPLVKVVAVAMSGSPCHCSRFMKHPRGFLLHLHLDVLAPTPSKLADLA